MGWLTRRDPSRRIFEDGVRWVEAIKNHSADAEQFARWAMRSHAHIEAFREAWVIWHEVKDGSAHQPKVLERPARVHQRVVDVARRRRELERIDGLREVLHDARGGVRATGRRRHDG